MKNLEKGTVVWTVLLFIGLINQTLIMFGKRGPGQYAGCKKRLDQR